MFRKRTWCLCYLEWLPSIVLFCFVYVCAPFCFVVDFSPHFSYHWEFVFFHILCSVYFDVSLLAFQNFLPFWHTTMSRSQKQFLSMGNNILRPPFRHQGWSLLWSWLCILEGLVIFFFFSFECIWHIILHTLKEYNVVLCFIYIYV